MSLWVLLSLLAAAFQTARFALQKRAAATGLGPEGATLSRFAFASPVALLGAGALVLAGAGPGAPPGAFWLWCAAGGLAQVLATICVVRLFALRDFAVGITLKKTEVLLTAAAGLVLLGDRLTPGAALFLALGFPALLLLGGRAGDWRRLDGRAVGLGLAAGALFAVSASCYRGATLSLPDGTAFARALVTLAVVTTLQAAGLSAFLALRRPGEVGRVLFRWRETALVGATSLLGSGCWFWAFALAPAALVKAVGQVELILSFLAGAFIFGERPGPRALAGMALLGVSITGVILVG